MKQIAVVQGAPSAEVQTLFRSLIGRWRPSARLAGVIAEDHGLPDRACTAGYLVSLTNGERFQIFQDLGPGSKKCQLAGAGALAAAASVRRDVAAGCDLVVLSKFGALEHPDELKRRLDEAAKYISIDQLGISPQCGFSSTVEGNEVTIEAQKAKLALCVSLAREVWGSL